MNEQPRTDEHEKVVIYTLAWRGDQSIRDESTNGPTAHLHCRVFIDGKELISALSASIETRGGDFAQVHIHLSPGEIELVSCTQEEWDHL